MSPDLPRVPDPDLQDILTCQGDDCGAIVIRHDRSVCPYTWVERERMSGTVLVLLCVNCAIKKLAADDGISRADARNRVMQEVSG